MVTRRYFLLGAGSLSLASVLTLPSKAYAAGVVASVVENTTAGFTISMSTRQIVSSDIGKGYKLYMTPDMTTSKLQSNSYKLFKSVGGVVTQFDWDYSISGAWAGGFNLEGVVTPDMVGGTLSASGVFAYVKGTASVSCKAVIGSESYSTTVSSTKPVIRGLPVKLVKDSKKLAFAHYFPTFPVMIENLPPAQEYYSRYLDPHGEGDAHLAGGGFVRDRPSIVPVYGSGVDYEFENMKAEVRAAKAVGIDGFFVDLITDDRSHVYHTRVQKLIKAASVLGGFNIVLQPDLDCLAGRSGAAIGNLVSDLVDTCVYRDNGAVVVAPFKAERGSDSFYSELFSTMKNRGFKGTLWPICLEWTNEFYRIARKYGSAGGDWGTKDALFATYDGGEYPTKYHSDGGRWIHSVGVQDYRPKDNVVFESSNTSALRTLFSNAKKYKSDMLLVVTWNDYSETSNVAPSVNQGTALLQMLSYFIMDWRGYGQIVSESVFLSHRKQPRSLVPTVQTGKVSIANPAGCKITDTVEALVLLKSPASVTLKSGTGSKTVNCPAGLSVVTVGLQPGLPEVTVSRNRVTVIKKVSSTTVVTKNSVADFSYRFCTNLPSVRY